MMHFTVVTVSYGYGIGMGMTLAVTFLSPLGTFFGTHR